MQENDFIEKPSFGTFFKSRRIQNGFTQKQLAEKLFVTESTVSKWEKDVARPDISLLPKISELLGVTEHELIIASIDEKTRETEKQAQKWRKLSFSWQLFFFICYALTLVTCFIVNLVVDKKLDWFFVVLSALVLSFTFTNLPKYIKKNKILFIPLCEFLALVLLFAVINIYVGGTWLLIATVPTFFGLSVIFLPIIFAKTNVPYFIKLNNAIISLCIDFILLLLTLLYICIYTEGNWFIKIALPISSAIFTFVLLFVILLQNPKINGLLKTSFSLFLWLTFYIVMGYGVSPVLSNADINMENSTAFDPFAFNFGNWTGDSISNNVNFIVFVVLVTLTIIFLLFGIKRQKKIKKSY